jgi:hypothetical protein
MAFTGSFMCTSFKVELMQAVHNFTATTGHVFKIALYTNSASPDATTTVYSSTNEVTGTGYTAGGFAWTAAQNRTPISTGGAGTTAYTGWTVDPSWTTATFTARGAVIYNSSASNKAVAVLDFGADKPVSSGTFTIVQPTFDASNAILRIA